MVKQGGYCQCRGNCIVHQAVSRSWNNVVSQTGSSEEGIGGNENRRHYAALWNC